MSPPFPRTARMTFRIFQVSADGVALPVYDQNAPDKHVATAAATASDATASGATARTAPVEVTSAEWDELRERLRRQASPKPVRKSVLGL